MSRTVEVIVISPDPELAGLAEILQSEGIGCRVVGSCADAREVVESTADCVAVMDCELPEQEAFQVYRLLHGSRLTPTLMLVPSGSYQRFALDPHRPSPDDCVAKPVGLGELALRVKAMILRGGFELPPVQVPSNGTAAERSHEPDGLCQGQIIALFSVKGGVGKSTIAVNLAVGLARIHRSKTILVDANLWFGDLGILLNVDSRRSLFDLCSGGEPDITALQKATYQHDSGVTVLLRPADLVAVEKLDVGSIVKALAVCRALFDYVVVDTQSSLDELNLQILEVADRILLVTTPEMSATANVSRFLGIAEALGYLPKISLIVNRFNCGIDTDTLQASLGLAVACRVISAGRPMVEAANEGAPLFLRDPAMEQPVTRDLARIVELVAGQKHSEIRGESRKRLPFLKRSGK